MSTSISRFTKTATLRRTSSAGLDEFGDPVLVETTEAVPCHVRSLSADETGDGVESVRWKLYLSPDVLDDPLEVSDRVTVDGQLFELVEPPKTIYNPRTRMIESVQAVIEETK
jgi:hypothetical protein